MPTTVWTGGGQQIAQQATITVDAVAVGGTLSAVINAKSITYTCVTGDTTTTAATELQELLVASDVPPEFAEITWTNPSAGVVLGIAAEPGTPFTLTKAQSGGATCTLANTVANSSQSDINNANNWNRSGVAQLPQSGDDVVLANTDVPLLWNLTALNGTLLNSFTRYQSFTGSVGLPENNPLGYVEYKPTYLQLASNVTNFPLILGAGAGNGPTRERYDMQSYRYTGTIIASGSPADAYAIRLLGSHGLNAITVQGTSVGVCMLPTEVTPYGATLNLATVANGGTLDCGAGCAFSGTAGGGTLTIQGGSTTLFAVPSVVARNNATVTLSAESGTYSSISCINGVQLTLTAPMTISVLTLLKSSNLDNTNNLGAVTITTSTIDGDTCTIQDPNNGITYSNATSVQGSVTSGPLQYTGTRTERIT